MPKKSSAKSKARLVTDATPTVARVTYRRAEAAEALGVDIQTIDDWIADGVLRASKPPGPDGKPGRCVLIRVADVLAMLAASAVRAA